MDQVPVRELRNFTARVLDRVKDGETLEITERGRVVARLVPVEAERWEQLRALGLIEPAEAPGDPLELDPLEPVPGLPLPSTVLEQLRADER
ncbi:MAG: type II toxin-antitoxin system prevent-host-death family antitoxin [Candidatus Dormibacteraeota bacterium]|nr:type II toxin-antitoxin system prevent-host-death family antitoxin [Candidatus Dormibacteraeota bacterium]